MDGETFTLLSGALSFGAPLLLVVHELLVLRRGDDGGNSGRDRRAPEPPPPQPAPAGIMPLPDCLIPKPLPHHAARVRALEDA
jgi:hypothetical protein